jgi:hypothetical protein
MDMMSAATGDANQVAAVLAAFGWRRLQRIAVEHCHHVEIVELLVPQHPGKAWRWMRHMSSSSMLSVGRRREVGLGDALAEDVIKIGDAPLR